MNISKTAVIVLGAGKGTRMQSDLPKVMVPLCNKPMIRHIINTLEAININDIVVVISPDGEIIKNEVKPHKTVVQTQPLGTGHAVLAAKTLLNKYDGNIIVIFGDQPLYTKETITKVLKKRQEGYSIVSVGFSPKDPLRFGRLKMNGDELLSIVEFKDANEEEKKIKLCNSGLMCFDGNVMFDILDELTPNNAAGEYYLTDAIAIARQKGLKCSAVECAVEEAMGIDTKEVLNKIEQYLLQKEN